MGSHPLLLLLAMMVAALVAGVVYFVSIYAKRVGEPYLSWRSFRVHVRLRGHISLSLKGVQMTEYVRDMLNEYAMGYYLPTKIDEVRIERLTFTFKPWAYIRRRWDTAAAAAAAGGSNEALVVEMHGMRILHSARMLHGASDPRDKWWGGQKKLDELCMYYKGHYASVLVDLLRAHMAANGGVIPDQPDAPNRLRKVMRATQIQVVDMHLQYDDHALPASLLTKTKTMTISLFEKDPHEMRYFGNGTLPDSMRVVIDGMAICIGAYGGPSPTRHRSVDAGAVAAAAANWAAKSGRLPSVDGDGASAWSSLRRAVWVAGKWSVGTAHDAGLLSREAADATNMSLDERLRSASMESERRALLHRAPGARRRRRAAAASALGPGGGRTRALFVARCARARAGRRPAAVRRRPTARDRGVPGGARRPMQTDGGIPVHAPPAVCAAATSPDGIAQPHAHAALHAHWPALGAPTAVPPRPRLRERRWRRRDARARRVASR